MANQNAKQDDNQFPALIGHSGTAGTADTIRVVVNSDGQIGVFGTVETSGGAGGGTTVTVDHGTVDINSLPNIPGGTVSTNMLSGTLNLGTVVPNGGTVALVSNLATGTVAVVSSVTSVANVVKGTVTRVEGGTISTNMLTGTLNLGTVVPNGGTISQLTAMSLGTVKQNPRPATNIISSITANGTAAIGTLVAAGGAGTGIWVTDFELIVGSGTLDLCLAYGSQVTGAQVVHRGLYTPGGGVSKSFNFPSYGGTANSPLTYQIVAGAGTAYWNAHYWVEGTA